MRDDFTEEVKRVLANRVSNTCSICKATTSGPQDDASKFVNVGVAAHITPASSGGPRYDEYLTPEQRRSPMNGIWLCQTCAHLVDSDEVHYPTEFLKAIKTVREHEVRMAVGRTPIPSMESESGKKCKKIAEWKGKRLWYVIMPNSQQIQSLGPRPWSPTAVLVEDVNEFFGVLKGDGWDRSQSYPLENIKLGLDSRMKWLEILDCSRG